MPKSKNKKNQKKRSQARTQKIYDINKKNQKMQRDMLMEMIRKEKEKGAFNDLPSMDPSGVNDDLNLDGPVI